jgi:VanZ family protein
MQWGGSVRSVQFERIVSRRVSRFVIVVLVMLVLGLSLTPRGVPIPVPSGIGAVFGHFAAYALLAFFTFRAVDRAGALQLAYIIAGCAFLGGIIEIVQPLVGRTRELVDFIADLAGAAIGAGSAAMLLWSAHRAE